MSESEPAVVFRAGGDVSEIVLNRPRVLNAMNMDWVRDFKIAADAAHADTEAKVFVVRGEGRSFCAGLDLNMIRGQGMPMDFYTIQEDGFTTLEALDRLVVAKIHGYCLGGGVQLIISCDIRIARADSIFSIPAPTEGLFPGMAVWRLPRFIGLGRAMRFAISGEQIDANEALSIGLVDYVCPVEGFEEASAEIVKRYLHVSQRAARAAKRMMRHAFERDFASVYAESLPLLEDCRRSEDVLATAEAWQARRAKHAKS